LRSSPGVEAFTLQIEVFEATPLYQTFKNTDAYCELAFGIVEPLDVFTGMPRLQNECERDLQAGVVARPACHRE
jgi:hypothetical protein